MMVVLEVEDRLRCPAIRKDGNPCQQRGLGGVHEGFCIGHSPKANRSSVKTAKLVEPQIDDVYIDESIDEYTVELIQEYPVEAINAGETTVIVGEPCVEFIDVQEPLIIGPDVDTTNAYFSAREIVDMLRSEMDIEGIKADAFQLGRQSALNELLDLANGPLHIGCKCPSLVVLLDIVNAWERTLKNNAAPSPCPNGVCDNCKKIGQERKLESIILCDYHRSDDYAGSACRCRAYCSRCASMVYESEKQLRLKSKKK